MPRLAHHGPLIAFSHHAEESRRCACLKGERRGKLHQQRAAVTTEAIRFREKSLERSARPSELVLVGDEPRHLDGKPELVRRGRRPLGICRQRVRPIERRIDFCAPKHSSVALKVRALWRAALCRRPWNRPARCSNVDLTGHNGSRHLLARRLRQRTCDECQQERPWRPATALRLGASSAEAAGSTPRRARCWSRATGESRTWLSARQSSSRRRRRLRVPFHPPQDGQRPPRLG